MHCNKKGSILIPALIFMLMLAILGMVMLQVGTSNIQTTVNDHDARQAYYSAKSVCDMAVQMLTNKSGDNYASMDALVEPMGTDTAPYKTAVTPGSLPADNAALQIACTGKTAAGTTTTQTIEIIGAVEYNGYKRSVTRTVTITRVTGGSTLAFYSVAQAGQADYDLQGEIIGDVVIKNAGKISLWANGNNKDGIITGNVYFESTGEIVFGGNTHVGDENGSEVAVYSHNGTVRFKKAYVGSLYVQANKVLFENDGQDAAYRLSSTNVIELSAAQKSIENSWSAANFGGTLPSINSAAVKDKLQEYENLGTVPAQVKPYDGSDVHLFLPSVITESCTISNIWNLKKEHTVTIDTSGGSVDVYFPLIHSIDATFVIQGGGTANIYFDNGIDFKKNVSIEREDEAAIVNFICTGNNAGVYVQNQSEVKANIINTNGLVQIQNGTVQGSVAAKQLNTYQGGVLDMESGASWGDLTGAFQWEGSGLTKPEAGAGGQTSVTYSVGNYKG